MAEPRPATREELARVHDPAYLDLIESTRGRSARLDPDIFTSPESLDLVALAAGATVQTARRTLEGAKARRPGSDGGKVSVNVPANFCFG